MKLKVRTIFKCMERIGKNTLAITIDEKKRGQNEQINWTKERKDLAHSLVLCCNWTELSNVA